MCAHHGQFYLSLRCAKNERQREKKFGGCVPRSKKPTTGVKFGRRVWLYCENGGLRDRGQDRQGPLIPIHLSTPCLCTLPT